MFIFFSNNASRSDSSNRICVNSVEYVHTKFFRKISQYSMRCYDNETEIYTGLFYTGRLDKKCLSNLVLTITKRNENLRNRMIYKFYKTSVTLYLV